MEYDIIFLKRAFELAKLGQFTSSPNPNVGCVIVKNNKILGEGYHKIAGGLHAEIHALNMAKSKSAGATAYVTFEPCSHQGKTPACVDALISSGIVRVVSTIVDPNPEVCGKGFHKLEQSGVVVKHNLMLDQANEINAGFIKRMKTGLPKITLKLASSLDGKISMRSGESKWITSIESRQDVQVIRAKSDAILSTSISVICDNASLDVRWFDLPIYIQSIYPKDILLRQPIRIIIDSSNRILPSHKIVNSSGKIWLVRLKKDKLIWPKSVSQVIVSQVIESGKIRINFLELLKIIGKSQINNLLVESGSEFSNFLLKNRLVDELILYLSPKLLGSNTKPICILENSKRLSDALDFSLHEITKIGEDIKLNLIPKK